MSATLGSMYLLYMKVTPDVIGQPLDNGRSRLPLHVRRPASTNRFGLWLPLQADEWTTKVTDPIVLGMIQQPASSYCRSQMGEGVSSLPSLSLMRR